MKSVLASTLLAALLLNAGAFASDNRGYLRGKTIHPNVTVVTKNQAWPVKVSMTDETCAVHSSTPCTDA